MKNVKLFHYRDSRAHVQIETAPKSEKQRNVFFFLPARVASFTAQKSSSLFHGLRRLRAELSIFAALQHGA